MWILTGIFTFLGMVSLLPFLAAVAAAAGFTGAQSAAFASYYDGTPILAGLPETTIVGALTTIGLVFLALSVLHFLTAWGLWNLHRWAWGLGVVLAVIGLLLFPIGTIFAVLTLVYLVASRATFAPHRYADDTDDRPRAV